MSRLYKAFTFYFAPFAFLVCNVFLWMPLSSPAQVKSNDDVKIKSSSQAEAQLIHIYQLIGAGQNREALNAAEKLVKTQPNFQLAHLVHGDLLSSFARPVRNLGDVPFTASLASTSLSDLREESSQRIKALQERPPADSLPAAFLALSPRNKHAIAVDASRSRLYLFENSSHGVHLIADYYISIGKLGIEKLVEGDQRTPLGVYFITQNLDRKKLTDFYGTGALPINYPNPLDLRRGKTGSGIWLHGTPSTQFARPPKASDGCVVLTNTDLEKILSNVRIRTTPVVIADHLQWVSKHALKTESEQFANTLQAWLSAKSNSDFVTLINFYSHDFSSYGKNLVEWARTLGADVAKLSGKQLTLTELSILRWTDKSDVMVVTFDEIAKGTNLGAFAMRNPISTKRQYWIREGNFWKIFFEGTV